MVAIVHSENKLDMSRSNREVVSHRQFWVRDCDGISESRKRIYLIFTIFPLLLLFVFPDYSVWSFLQVGRLFSTT